LEPLLAKITKEYKIEKEKKASYILNSKHLCAGAEQEFLVWDGQTREKNLEELNFKILYF
jgi:hypothetical protein